MSVVQRLLFGVAIVHLRLVDHRGLAFAACVFECRALAKVDHSPVVPRSRRERLGAANDDPSPAARRAPRQLDAVRALARNKTLDRRGGRDALAGTHCGQRAA